LSFQPAFVAALSALLSLLGFSKNHHATRTLDNKPLNLTARLAFDLLAWFPFSPQISGSVAGSKRSVVISATNQLPYACSVESLLPLRQQKQVVSLPIFLEPNPTLMNGNNSQHCIGVEMLPRHLVNVPLLQFNHVTSQWVVSHMLGTASHNRRHAITC
jgi:hypothetical protein